ncbi:MAG: DNA starvation/stationary phase protection protein, partial [Chlorobi bacterium]|nr:DNA starvation/stationary phase protection protein [Chlorobiota bacterium]
MKTVQTPQIVSMLNRLLADYHVYYQNLRAFHWNIRGRNFFELHTLFEKWYNQAAERIDQIAERILALKHTPLHTLEDYLREASLREAPQITDGD